VQTVLGMPKTSRQIGGLHMVHPEDLGNSGAQNPHPPSPLGQTGSPEEKPEIL